MRALHSFTVAAKIPDELDSLRRLAADIGWINQRVVRDLFRRVDAYAVDGLGLDPIGVLARTSAPQLEALANDRDFVRDANELVRHMVEQRDASRWFQRRAASPLQSVAYFSPEFGLAASVPQYSGGLGVLAGDHLKAAADLGVPLVGVGLFYRHGYFRQQLDRSSRQVERFPRLAPSAMAMEEVPDLSVSIDLAGAEVRARIWRVVVDTISLYLLDAEVEGNDGLDQLVTDRLYGGGSEQRIRQELLLGVGGFRAVRALGLTPSVFHLNEGHAGFLALELIRAKMHDEGLSYEAAIESVRPQLAFTTHTPVPAGIDRFPRALMEQYFAWWCRDTGRSIDDLMALGAEPGVVGDAVQQQDASFNVAAMSLRLAGWAGGVSELHGDVSRTMFGSIWPAASQPEVPIRSITNGVYGPTWVSDDLAAMFTSTVGEDWVEAPAASWETMQAVDPSALWRVRSDARTRLVDFTRQRLRASIARRRGSSQADAWCDTVLSPDALTIGFARRFATYKRATLMLRDIDRFRALVSDPDRPVQFLFAGKAHPADDPGKEFLRAIATLADDPELRTRVVFLEDYDIDAGRMLTQGCDVWLNTPLRPMEACGTSGMKSAYNGGLNCSVLDGWWDEWFTPDRGWAIPSADWIDDDVSRDDAESEWLFDLLEREVVPLFYDRDTSGLPIAWLNRVRSSIAGLAPLVSAHRMVCDYVTTAYEPVAERFHALPRDAGSVEAFTLWRERVKSAWHAVAVTGVNHDAPSDAQGSRTIEATVHLGELTPADVRVELVHGRIGVDGEFVAPEIATMTVVNGPNNEPARDAGHMRVTSTFGYERAGEVGFSVRVVPDHAYLAQWLDLGLICWG